MSEPLSLEGLVLRRLLESNVSADRIIEFPTVFERICPLLCLKKKEAWTVLKSLEGSGVIKIIPYHGVRVLKRS